MTIVLPKNLEARLREQAKQRGMEPDAYVAELLSQSVGVAPAVNSLAQLFEQMQQQQWTDDPTEIARRAHDEQEFMDAMNQNRLDVEGPEARRLYP